MSKQERGSHESCVPRPATIGRVDGGWELLEDCLYKGFQAQELVRWK